MSVQSLSIERMNTPTGRMMIVVDGELRLRALDWEDHEPRMQRLLRQHYGEINLREEARPTAVVHALEAYFNGDLAGLNSLPTATNGTDFQRTVWAALRHIFPGETVSYGRLAARIGRPAAVRAVGLAIGANPIAIVVPCHRVIGANGALTGFGGGLERKRWLLAHERACSPRPDGLISESEGIYDGSGRPFAARRAYGTRSTYQDACETRRLRAYAPRAIS